jgi:pimeloyl-ACP methyl ester carboxylesterase
MLYSGGVLYDEDMAARLKDISAITLIVHGEKEGIIPEESSVILRSKIKTSYMIYLYDAAHVPEVDQPERFSNLVGDFLVRGQAFLVNKGDRAPAGVGRPN